MKLSLSLEMIFTGEPYLQRVARAAQLGVQGVEFWGAAGKNFEELKPAATAGGLDIVAIGANRVASLADERDRDALLAEVGRSLETAKSVGCSGLLLLSDGVNPDGSSTLEQRIPAAERKASTVAGLKALAPLAERAGCALWLEPLNTRRDHPRYSLSSTAAALEMLEPVSHPRIGLLLDCYHMALMGEDVCAMLRRTFPFLGHVHVAGTVERGELERSELDYRRVAETLQSLDYRGHVGLEFAPRGSEEAAVRSAVQILTGRA